MSCLGLHLLKSNYYLGIDLCLQMTNVFSCITKMCKKVDRLQFVVIRSLSSFATEQIYLNY